MGNAIVRAAKTAGRPGFRAAKRVKAALERRLHPRRRKAAIDGLRLRGTPRRVVVVCLGNICRSPYGAFRLSTLLHSGQVEVVSRGFLASGRPSPERALEIAEMRGVDLRPHRSARIEAFDYLPGRDLYLVMEQWQRTRLTREVGIHRRDVLLLGDLDPEIPAQRAIPDPYSKGAETFIACFDRIDRCLDQLARVVGPGAASGEGRT